MRKKKEGMMSGEFYKLIDSCLCEELKEWEDAGYPVASIARSVLSGFSEKIAEESERHNLEFDRRKMMEQFYNMVLNQVEHHD